MYTLKCYSGTIAKQLDGKIVKEMETEQIESEIKPYRLDVVRFTDMKLIMYAIQQKGKQYVVTQCIDYYADYAGRKLLTKHYWIGDTIENEMFQLETNEKKDNEI